MNRFIQSEEGTILFRMSDNAEYYNEGNGIFEVRYNNTQTRLFPTLLEAFLFYYTVEDEADLCDKTTGYILIERKIKLYLN